MLPNCFRSLLSLKFERILEETRGILIGKSGSDMNQNNFFCYIKKNIYEIKRLKNWFCIQWFLFYYWNGVASFLNIKKKNLEKLIRCGFLKK